MVNWPCSATSGNSIATKHMFQKADVHRGLLMPICKKHKNTLHSVACASNVVPRHLCPVRKLMPQEIVRTVTTTLWSTVFPNFCLLTLFSLDCLLRPAASIQQFEKCMADHGQHFWSIHGSVNIIMRKTRNATNYEAQKHVFLERPRLPQFAHQSKIVSPNCRPTPCSRKDRASFLFKTNAESPATSTYSRDTVTERVEEFTPFCAAASSYEAFPTPSYLSERHCLVVERKTKCTETRTQHEPSDTGLHYDVLRIRRSRLGAAILKF